MSAPYEKKVEAAFQKVLNSHGYGFHYSVLKLASCLADRETNQSAWVLEAAEFPVQVQGFGMRIDFVLRHRHSQSFYLLAECKRANPYHSNWCFARAPFVRRNRTTTEPLFLECFQRNVPITGSKDIYSSSKRITHLEDAYHIALEVRSGEKGDPEGRGRGAIEDAATQISRGIGGMVEFFSNNLLVLGEATQAYFLPVIFTTAQVWASDVDLSKAELLTGNVNLGDRKFTRKDFIFYQYHLSPGLKHSHSPNERPGNMGDYLDSEYIRTIAIVSAAGIDSFLLWSSAIDLY